MRLSDSIAKLELHWLSVSDFVIAQEESGSAVPTRSEQEESEVPLPRFGGRTVFIVEDEVIGKRLPKARELIAG
jgi:hypothetical protein